jgi:hypothetical protein
MRLCVPSSVDDDVDKEVRMDAIETAAPPIRRILRLAVLALLCLTLAGTARADSDPGAGSPDGSPTCTPGTAEAPLRHEDPAVEECLAVQIGLAASPNPTPSGGPVSFSWSVSPATDCWDNLGNSAWGNYSFTHAVSDPFTWVVSCMGNGVESAALYIGVQGGPPPPPPPPPGDHAPKGWLDSVDAGGVAYGWACDPDSYSAALEVRLYLDGAPGTGSFLGNPTASLTREPAVGDACGGSRNHGFAFTLPDSVRDGRTHSLHAYAVNIGEGSNVQLSGSPKSFQVGGGSSGDSDGDGVSDDADNCPEDPNSNQADADADGIGDECDIDVWLGVGSFSTWEASPESVADEPTAHERTAVDGASPQEPEKPDGSTIRCKIQLFAQTFTQAGLWDALRYEGKFRVCYRPHRSIVSIKDVHGDMVWVKFYLTWLGNDSGYPYAVIFGKYVEIYYRGTVTLCIIPRYGCGPQKHPWITIRFYANNTLEKTSGVT